MKAWIIALALLPGMAAAQSSLQEAARWCNRQDPSVTPDKSVAGCSWLIRSSLLTPQNIAAAFFYRANAYIALGDRAGAMADLMEATRANPQFGAAFFNLGLLRLAAGDRTGAIADFSEAIRLNPRDSEGFSNRGAAQAAGGDRLGAIADYTEAIRLNPRNAIAYLNRGLARAAEGDGANAISDYTEAIAINPRYAAAFTARGDVRTMQGDHAGAIADYSEAIRLDPRDARAFAMRGLLQRRVGQADAARADIEAAIRVVPPGDGRPHAARAGLALLRGDRAAARIDLAEALRRNNNDSVALGLRAILHAAGGDAARATADAAAARRIDPRITEVILSQFGPDLVLP